MVNIHFMQKHGISSVAERLLVLGDYCAQWGWSCEQEIFPGRKAVHMNAQTMAGTIRQLSDTINRNLQLPY
jgi:hypothetical protein